MGRDRLRLGRARLCDARPARGGRAAGRGGRPGCERATAGRSPGRGASARGLGGGALLAAPEVEAVYVGPPTHLHRAAVEAAAAAGKPVLCEKPMAATLADA